MSAPPVRVLIADDNRAVRRGLRLQLEAADAVRVVGEVANGADAVAVARAERPDVVLMDIQMPGLSGLDATRELTRDARTSPVAVIIMTSYPTDSYVTQALDAGAVGYLLKNHDSDQLLPAIRAAARGEALVSSRVTTAVLREFVRRGSAGEPEEPPVLLTAAERRVVSALAGGITSNGDIARHLSVSPHTVRSHIQAALMKVGVDDRTQLALWGARHGLDAPSRPIE